MQYVSCLLYQRFVTRGETALIAEETEKVRAFLEEARGWYTKASRFSDGSMQATLVRNFKEVSTVSLRLCFPKRLAE